LSQGEPSPQPEQRILMCQPGVHPRCQRCSDTSPDAIAPLHVRRLLLSTVRAFPPLLVVLCRLLTSAGRSGRSPPPSVLSGHPADLPRSAVRPSVHRRPIYKAQSIVDGGLRCRVPARPDWSHTSYRVRVPRPAHSLHASFRPHLAVTPLRFACPSAPRIPGQGTFTPKHDRMHGTHAKTERRGVHRVRCTPLLDGLAA